MPPCLTPFVMRKLSDRTDPHLTLVSFLSGVPLHNNSDENQGSTSNSIECFRGIHKTHVNRRGLRMIKINNLF